MEENHLDKKEKSHLISSGINTTANVYLLRSRHVVLILNLTLFWTLDSSDEGYSGPNKAAKGNSGFQKISGKAWGVLVSVRMEIVMWLALLVTRSHTVLA